MTNMFLVLTDGQIVETDPVTSGGLINPKFNVDHTHGLALERLLQDSAMTALVADILWQQSEATD